MIPSTSGSRTSSWCSVPKAWATRRASPSSLKAASGNPIENVLTGAPERPAIVATTALESMPPLRNAPRGTSLTMCRRTASRRSARSSSTRESSLRPLSGSKATSQ